jgi:putative transposase
MNSPKIQTEDYIDFLIACPKQATATEAARCQPDTGRPGAHDAYSRLLHRLEPDPETLWSEVQPQVVRDDGYLILDDTVLDKPFAFAMDLVHYVWSGRHNRVVKGIDLITLLWTDGDRHLPCDFRLYDKPFDGQSKNDHFRALLRTAQARGFRPRYVLFDSWYSNLDNLKLLRSLGWHWLTQLAANRLVNYERTGLQPVAGAPILPEGTIVHLQGFGMVKVFLIVTKDGDRQYWATDDLEMTELGRLTCADASWRIEEYHRGLKQLTNVDRCQARSERAQRNHIGMAVRAFVRFEVHCFHTGINWLQAKLEILRDAVRNYLARPKYRLNPTA